MRTDKELYRMTWVHGTVCGSKLSCKVLCRSSSVREGRPVGPGAQRTARQVGSKRQRTGMSLPITDLIVIEEMKRSNGKRYIQGESSVVARRRPRSIAGTAPRRDGSRAL